MFTRIRWRLVASIVVVLTIILGVLGVAVYFSLYRSLQGEVDRNLQLRGDEVASNLHEIGESILRVGSEGYRGGLFFIVVSPAGQVVANPQNASLDFDVTSQPFEGSPTFSTSVIGGEPTRLYVRPLYVQRVLIGVLVTGESLASEQAALQRLLVILVTGAGAGLLLSLAGAWYLSGQALIPIQKAFARQQEFVADASHELRTPLTILHSAVDLLNQHRAEPLEANGELFDDLRQEILRMERLAGDLLTLARQDLGQVELAMGEVDLASLTADVVRRAAPLAQEKRIALDFHHDHNPSPAEVDPDRIQQVLLILLDNALKHTPPEGRVSVSVSRQGQSVIIRVSDTGEGIPAEHLPRVFDRFYRQDQARTRSQGGAGLGLSIAKSLVEAHGGQLALTSVVGAGAEATIRLRASRVQASLAERVGQLASRVTHRPAHR
ncbi:MAG: ATP-binding protein [Dehalococcoidia bacterium]|nr:ATP-binding protein [Dehalococcoidia bacterium]